MMFSFALVFHSPDERYVKNTTIAAFCLLLAFGPASLAAQGAPSIDSTAFNSLTWRNVGPARGGRSAAVAGSSARPQEYWMGTTGGGVFKTTDGGGRWFPVSDKYFGGTIGAIGVSESDPDVVYAGTGEWPVRGNVSNGDGVYRTGDGGKTWSYIGLVETRQIARVRVHPKNPDVVFVAALGHIWGPNPDRGVFKSTDGGKHWRKVLFRNDSTGAVDLVMDPSNPDIMYAAMWQVSRKPWQLVSGGPGSGIFKSTDGGETWKEITRNPGLPGGLIGNVGLSVSLAKPSVVWAIIENDSGGVFRSGDGGATWTRTNAERKLRQRAWYYTKIFADPKDTNTVYVVNVSFHRSTDGGKTFRSIQTQHGDHHDFWIAPNDPQRMVVGDDGGAVVSTNAGRTWTRQEFATAQFYHVTTTNHFPYRICGAQQDNSTLCGGSQPDFGSSTQPWYDVGGGESGYIQVRPDDPNIVYAGSYGGYLTRKDTRTGFSRDINPWPDNPMGHSAGDLKYRFQWTFPILLSPHDPNTLYVGANVVFKSTDDGSSFAAISPDLTRHDPKTLGPSGGPITKDQTSVEYYATVFALAESPKEKGVIWAGSDDGLIHVTQNGGGSWANVTPADLPEWSRISIIEAGQHASGTAYVAANRFQLDDNSPYIYKTTDYGKTWTKIVHGINRGEFARAVREDPVRPGLLYAGTERGVWVSFDDGANWQRLQRNLPPVPVHDLAVKEGDLIAATHGRSFWILDDLSVLRQMAQDKLAKDIHLFQPRQAYRTFGAGVHYWLKTGGQKVKLEFLDAKGQLIRAFTSESDSITLGDSLHTVAKESARLDSLWSLGVLPPSVPRHGGEDDQEFEGYRHRPEPTVPNKAGLNSFTWDLSYPDAVAFDGMIFWAAAVNGPTAPPGTYSVRLSVGDKSESQSLVLKKDPRQNATQADLEEQFAFVMKVREKVGEANNAVRTIRNIKAQVTERLARTPAASRPALERMTGQLVSALSQVESEIYQVKNQSGQDPLNYPIKLNNKIAALTFVAGFSDGRPTVQTIEVFRLLSVALDEQLGRLKTTISTLLPPVNTELARTNLSTITPSAVEIMK